MKQFQEKKVCSIKYLQVELIIDDTNKIYKQWKRFSTLRPFTLYFQLAAHVIHGYFLFKIWSQPFPS